MKAWKKIFAGLVVSAMAFSFFSCGETGEEDEDLTVKFTPSAGAVASGTGIRLIASDSGNTYGNDDVTTKIFYTTDGADITFTFKESSTAGTYTITAKAAGGTATEYTGAIPITKGTTIKARSVKTNAKTYGALCTAVYTIASASDSSSGSTDTDLNALPGTFKFELDDDKISFLYYASAAGSTTDGTDVSETGTFKYGEYDHCQYQIQFSYSKKTWYLYTREVSGKIIEPVQSGTYTGDPWKNTSDSNQVILTDGQGNKNPITISNVTKNGNKVATGSFLLDVSSVNTAIGATADAK